MATRQIQISITGEAGSYSATVDRIIQKNAQLNRDAIRGAQQASLAVNVWENSLAGVGRQLTTLVSFGALVALGKQALDAAGRFQDLSEQTGLSARTIAGLEVSAKQMGLSVEEITQGVIRMQRALINSREGTNEQTKAFARLFTEQERSKLATSTQENFHSVQVFVRMLQTVH